MWCLKYTSGDAPLKFHYQLHNCLARIVIYGLLYVIIHGLLYVIYGLLYFIPYLFLLIAVYRNGYDSTKLSFYKGEQRIRNLPTMAMHSTPQSNSSKARMLSSFDHEFDMELTYITENTIG